MGKGEVRREGWIQPVQEERLLEAGDVCGDVDVFLCEFHNPLRKVVISIGVEEDDGWGRVAGDEGGHVLQKTMSAIWNPCEAGQTTHKLHHRSYRRS